MLPPAVLIVGAGMLQVPLMIEAKALGLVVIVTDRDPHAPGVEVADLFYQIDTSEVQAHAWLGKTLRHSPDYTLRGVCTAGADVAPSVAAAAEEAGAQGIPPGVATLTYNKAEVREALSDADLGIYQPRWIVSEGNVPITTLQALEDGRLCGGYPVVVKPLSERASRGVTIAETSTEFLQAVAKAHRYGNPYLIEQWLCGSEHSAEVIVGNEGEVLWFNIVDRFFDYSSRVPIERGHVNPTSLHDQAQQQILLMALATAQALGVTWGPFKVDCLMTADGPKILEVTARLSGGWDCQYTSPATDRHPMKLLLQLACGLPLDAQPQMFGAQGYAACAAVIPQKTGILQSSPALAALPSVVMTVRPGDSIAPLEHNAQRCGYAFAHAGTYAEAWDMAQCRAAAAAAQMEILPTE